MRVELKDDAHCDIEESVDFYEDQQPGLGDYFSDCLESDLKQLELQGGIHERVYGIHRKMMSRFPFGIYYRVVPAMIEVVAILDCRRDPNDIANRLRRESELNPGA